MKHKTTLINNDWDIILKDEFQKKSFAKLMRFIVAERKEHTIFPSEEKVFTALKLSSFSQTKIVIIGQDPYHG
ncbi:MAG: uracil-DNA glycosylase, partial [Bacteroidota bacterium]|nr:uracil-DNA glycosylase [Bacteroidota bacterium]